MPRFAPLILLLPVLQAADEFNAVEHGRKVFESNGCIVCHAVEKDDASAKTGPNLYGLFETEPHDREVLQEAGAERIAVTPDKKYFKRSVRNPASQLAIATHGPLRGQAYPAAMPTFTGQVIPDDDLEAVWHYLRTLADDGRSGPAVVMMTKREQGPVSSLVEIKDELPVADRPRVFRARVAGLSGRVLHVGLPGHMNYSFDPRLLSVRRVWSGGFLNLAEERQGRGGQPSILGHGAQVVLDDKALLNPLTEDGKAVDFEFKEPDAGDDDAVIRHLHDDVDFLTKLRRVDAEYLGHFLTPSGEPTFRFRVGANLFEESIQLTPGGGLMVLLRAKLETSQRLRLRADGLTNIAVNGGELKDGVWTLPAAGRWMAYVLTANLQAKPVEMLPVGASENFGTQPLVVAAAEGGRRPVELPPGYRLLTWQPPYDIFGGRQLFEPTGIAVARDGTIVLATRAAGVWRIRDGYWSCFAEGTFECLGVAIEDDHGDRIVVAQKPEITRMIDSDGDGRADRFDTVCDDFGFHVNYHEYTHGLARDSEGNYYFTLNLAHHGNKKASWGGGQNVMGSMGGYRGWACRVTPDGRFEPFAGGLRSPAGIGTDPDGRLWYAENQGDYVGSSKLVPLEQGKFYGHVASMVSLPGMKPGHPDLTHDNWKGRLRKGAVWLPQSRLCNSPGHPAWDLTEGKFGAYAGQCFIGDQTQSRMMRVVTEQVEGIDQGCVIPFMSGLASGAMRPCFLPDGSLLIGQTGRGWGSKGGHQDALQQIVWDGDTVAAEILGVSSASNGYELHLTQPLAAEVTAEALAGRIAIESWYYLNRPQYGSPEEDLRKETISKVEIAADRRSVKIQLEGFGGGDGWTDRIYQIKWSDADKAFAQAPRSGELLAYFTLRAIPR